MLTRAGCEHRQRRLLEQMAQRQWDAFATTNYRTVYYLTRALCIDQPTLFVLLQDGSSILVSPMEDGAVATEMIRVETYSIERDISQPMQDAVDLLHEALKRKKTSSVSRCAVERSHTPGLIESELINIWPKAELCDAGPTLLRLRKRKEDDEVQEIRESLALCKVAYRAARETIRAGITEIDVYNAMQAAVTRAAGTFVELKGDFACGERAIRGGGYPTPRVVADGDLYILDLFPAPALYAGDTCRTFVVGKPTGLQLQAWEIVQKAQCVGEAAMYPHARARDVYSAVKEFLDSQIISQKSFWHHAGHGIGHNGHEAPRLIPGSDDLIEAGDVVALEPAIYSTQLQGGIRLENNYFVGEKGLENLFDFSLEL